MENIKQEQSANQTLFKINQMLSFCQIHPPNLEHLPPALIEFMNKRLINIQQLTIPIPRYIRVHPNHQISLEQLSNNLKLQQQRIVSIDQQFYAIDPNCKISQCPLYLKGLLYGMDYSSSIPVRCLDMKDGYSVLELCSAPGNKSMYLADNYPNSSIKGVEINQNRANVMNNLIKKYKLDKRIEVIVADGTKYHNQQLFDRVIVDAECTHEGSLKHINKFMKEQKECMKKSEIKEQKRKKIGRQIMYDQPEDKKPNKAQINANNYQEQDREGYTQLSAQQHKQFKKNNTNPYTSQIKKSNQWTQQDFQQRFLDPFKLNQLQTLQFGLLSNGFSLLKPGGIIVYSTCSFDEQQNEQIISAFLDKNDQGELLDASADLNSNIPWKQGTLKGTIKLSPKVSLCGGMFISKLRKKPIKVQIQQKQQKENIQSL